MIDAHVHLQADEFNGDRPAVIARALQSGIQLMACNGSAPSDWNMVRELALAYPQVYPCYGVHPWYVDECGPDWQTQLESYLKERDSAVGEIGLDRWLEKRDEPLQQQVFIAQLDIACRLQRVVMIHCLQAWGWLMAILENRPPEKIPPFMIHACGASRDLIKPLTQLGGYFSFAGNIFLPHKEKARETIKAIPLERLLLETDAPDMPPPSEMCLYPRNGANGKPTNEPANLAAIYHQTALLLDIPLNELTGTIGANWQRLVNL